MAAWIEVNVWLILASPHIWMCSAQSQLVLVVRCMP